MSRFDHTSLAARQCHASSNAFTLRFFNQKYHASEPVFWIYTHEDDIDAKEDASGDDEDRVLPRLGLRRIDL